MQGCVCVCVCLCVCWGEIEKSMGEQEGKEGENLINQGAPMGAVLSRYLVH